MCAILGLSCKDKELTNYIVKELLLQSQIRGKHATGISFYDNGENIGVISKPIPSSKFIEDIDLPSGYVIGHCRYSTSDLKYNQPLLGYNISLVHNGVITQESPEQWEQDFGCQNLKTRNDSELLLRCIEEDGKPFVKFDKSSIACGYLTGGKMFCFRGNTRPLWLFNGDIDSDCRFTGFASTEDIIFRTMKKLGLHNNVNVMKTEPFVKYIFMHDDSIKEVSMKVKHPSMFENEQQISTKIENKYV